jgi:hypothetical protein
VDQRALRESNKDSNGERENDALTKALQTKEQQGLDLSFGSGIGDLIT